MSGFTKSIVDSEGNINSDYLSKELKAALEADVRFRQTDNMKKRAVKVAGDYSEFKNMVAAAHLKKLTQKEVESLSHAKKGWQKAVVKDTSSSAQILTKEVENEQLINQNAGVEKSLKTLTNKHKPKTVMELDRDLHRLPDLKEKLRYLYSVGLKRIKTLLTAAGDTDMLEQLLVILTSDKEALLMHSPLQVQSDLAKREAGANAVESEVVGEASSSCIPPGEGITPEPAAHKNEVEVDIVACTVSDVKGTNSSPLPSVIAKGSERIENMEASDKNCPEDHEETISVLNLKQRIKWLKAIAEFEKASLMVKFAPDSLLYAVLELLEAGVADLSGKVSNAVAKYQSGLSK